MKSKLRGNLHDWDRHEKIIVFDGICNFCNAIVNFTTDRDPQRKFKFSTLQSEGAQRILEELELSKIDSPTMFVIESGCVFTKSTAALRVVRQLDSFWPLLYAFILIPRPIRDTVYDFVARNRYQWMGKSESCRVPTPDDHERFI